ncbi:helix-turn-helix transcriptional regulator [Streptomyces sp. 8K308]|uniref:helix-turn-helix domain-containing protein n=1 Tax=Streptomyces sp. 8K308 TaxID=2530388 RepID=UPI001FB7CCD8|nr:helix-turn-helix transcriptional regulator [Streptomyces sp. 8K308]
MVPHERVRTVAGHPRRVRRTRERQGGRGSGQAGTAGRVLGHRLAEIRRAVAWPRSKVAERMEVTKGRVSQIEQGRTSGQEVLARYVAALGGRLHQAICFDNGGIAAIA